MAYEIANESKKMLANGAKLYASGSEAKVNGIAAVVIATQNERLNSLSVPAARRPKAKDIQAAIRQEFGGDSKETDRGRYEICSLAFRVLNKLEKAHEATLTQAMQVKVPAKLGADLAALAGRYTEDALRAWVVPATAGGKQEKTAGEKLLAYLEKNGPDFKDTDIDALVAWTTAEKARRKNVEMALKEAV
jgi:hypothetical protein